MFSKNIGKIINIIRTGKSHPSLFLESSIYSKFDKIYERLTNILIYALFQRKLFREKNAGIIHFFIFWGFLLFSLGVIESIFQGFYSNISFDFLKNFYSIITLSQDIFGVLVIFAVLWAIFRRHVLAIQRLRVDKEANKDATLILIMILFVVVSMFGQNISHLLKIYQSSSSISGELSSNNFELRPISEFLASFFLNRIGDEAEILYKTFWWIHIILIFVFLNYLPYSKHLHIISSIPNVFFSKTKDKKNIVEKLDLENENVEVYGAKDINDLSWKDILDGYACTECGRCTEACPAASSGKILSPKKIIVDIRKRAKEFSHSKLKRVNSSDDYKLSGKNDTMPTSLDFGSISIEKTLIHDFITKEEIWQCTTCMACVEECPVLIEHLDKIIDFRRYLVLNETNFPTELNSVFANLETNGNPWAFNKNDRVKWTEGLNIKTLAEDSDCDILFWVGCAGSFDSRNIKVSRAFAEILQIAGINFRILGNEEKCNGDTARRLGNEYLAQQLMLENYETLNKYGIKRIVTACPHCYNSFKNEYKQFNGNFQVFHHSEIISQLLSENKIEIRNEGESKTITFHDSCYLGRYNGIYEEPRNIIKSIEYLDLIELDRNKSNGFCCGAGGGQMFIEDDSNTRINLNRTEEILNKNVEQVCTACPFCMTMISDGIKQSRASSVIGDKLKKAQGNIEILDLAEIVIQNIKKS